MFLITAVALTLPFGVWSFFVLCEHRCPYMFLFHLSCDGKEDDERGGEQDGVSLAKSRRCFLYLKQTCARMCRELRACM